MMDAATAIQRLEQKATRLRILAESERHDKFARDAGESMRLDAEAIEILVAAVRREDPCPDCGGQGERFEHAPGCDNDLCALAAGYDDCAGEVVACRCTPTTEEPQ